MCKGDPLASSFSHQPLNTMRAEDREQVPGSVGRAVAGAHQLQFSPGKAGPRYQAVFRNGGPGAGWGVRLP